MSTYIALVVTSPVPALGLKYAWSSLWIGVAGAREKLEADFAENYSRELLTAHRKIFMYSPFKVNERYREE